VAADFDSRILTVDVVTAISAMKTKQVHFDLCVGADGSYSNVRRQLMRVSRYVPC
jgi:kynurenine 3-monooxygenase